MYRSKLSKKKLLYLSEKSNLIGAIYISLHLSLILITGLTSYILFSTQQYFIAFFIFYVHCIFFTFLGFSGASHELSHNTVFRSQKLNKFFLIIFSFLTWNNYIYFKNSHKIHHKSTLKIGIDYEIVLPIKSSLKDIIWSLSIDIPRFIRTIQVNLKNSINIVENIPFKQSKETKKNMVVWSRVLLLTHLLMIIFFISLELYPLLLIVSLAPFIATFLNKILAISQHIGMQVNSDDFRLNSSSIRLNKFLAFLYWQMNYHIEHHMYQSVPFYKLKYLRDEIENDLPPVKPGVFELVKEYIGLIK